MSLDSELVSYILADGTVSGLIAARCYPGKLPQSPAYPAIVYQRIDTPRLHELAGPGGMAHPRFQFSCWATTHAAARTLADALRARLNTGPMALATIRGSCRLDNEFDDWDDTVEKWRVVQDYIILHTE